MKLIKSFLFFVNSSDRSSGTISNFNLEMPPWLLSDIKQNNKIKVILQDFILRKSIYNIEASVNGTFIISETSGNNTNIYTLTIDSGFYSVVTLASYLSEKLTTNSPFYTYNITFNDITAKFLFEVTTKQGYTLGSISFNFSALNSSYELLGFERSTYNFTLSGQFLRLSSIRLINLQGEDRLYFRSSLCMGPNIKRRTSTGLIDYTDILASFSLSVDPLNIIYYIDNSSLFSCWLNSKAIQPIINFKLTNEFNIILPFELDYSFTLKFEYYQEDNTGTESVEILKEVRDINRLNLLSKNLKK